MIVIDRCCAAVSSVYVDNVEYLLPFIYISDVEDYSRKIIKFNETGVFEIYDDGEKYQIKRENEIVFEDNGFDVKKSDFSCILEIPDKFDIVYDKECFDSNGRLNEKFFSTYNKFLHIAKEASFKNYRDVIFSKDFDTKDGPSSIGYKLIYVRDIDNVETFVNIYSGDICCQYFCLHSSIWKDDFGEEICGREVEEKVDKLLSWGYKWIDQERFKEIMQLF